MHKGGWRFAVWVAAAMAAVTLVMAWIYDLPVRDPDSVAGPTYFRLPAILLAAFLLDVVPRAVWRAKSPPRLMSTARQVVAERWSAAHLRFALVGLAAWYVIYASFRNLKSFVPFVNRHLWDNAFARIDEALFLGHDPAELLHSLLGTGFAAHFLSFVYVAWIVLVPASLVVALVWTRDAQAAVWYVTAIGIDWVLGVAIYFALPSLGPVYAEPGTFSDLPRTYVAHLQETMMYERHEVLVNPFTTDAVQTIAAFASLHVGISVTMCVMAELLRLPRWSRISLWVFLGLTMLATVYLGWHYAVDGLGGAVIGVAAVWIAARGTGHVLRRRSNGQDAAIAEPSSRA